ncbi:MAG: AAA family ATPase [Lachnospiraceae bacterium]|nr:AAA family ATPase [Lachnospiraceae bacterium]
MKLLECNIINYGCLHNFSMEFEQGIHSINRPNGWGKTTLVSFLCAMLYGLDSTTRRSIRENERKHYQPWQGGIFGGSLEFEASGKQYRVERTFGRREREDTFKLYDRKTLQPSQDYSCNLGLELFGIDKAGYLQSTCVSQERHSSGYSDTLTARLIGISESAEDIRQYEQAIDSIEKALHFYVKTGNRGEIASLRREADAADRKLHEALLACSQLSDLENRLLKLTQEKEQTKRQLEEIRSRITAHAQQEVRLHYNTLKQQLHQAEEALEQAEDFFHDQLPEEADIEQYLQLCSQLFLLEQQKQQKSLNELQQQEYAFLQTFFETAESPAESFSDSADKNNENSIFTPQQQRLLKESALYQAEAAFLCDDAMPKDNVFMLSGDELPDTADIQEARQLFLQYQGFCNRKNECTTLAAAAEEQLQRTQKALEEEKTAVFACKEKLQLPLIFAFLITLAAGFSIGFFVSAAAGFIVALAGFCLTGFIAYYRLKPQSAIDRQAVPSGSDKNSQGSARTVSMEQRTSYETDSTFHTKAAARFQSQITETQERLDSINSTCSALTAKADFCAEKLLELSIRLQLPVNGSDNLSENFLSLLDHLQQQIEQYHLIRQKQYEHYKKQRIFYEQLRQNYNNYTDLFKQLKRIEQKLDDIRQDIRQYLSPYYPAAAQTSASGLESQLHRLSLQLADYKKLLADLLLATRNLNSFLQEHPDFKQEDRQTDPTTHAAAPLSVLQEQEALTQEQSSSCVEQISKLKPQLEQLQVTADSVHLLEEKKNRLTEQISDYEKRYRILSLTEDYLKKARHNLTESYLRSIEKHFQEYARFSEKKELQQARMGADFHMLIPVEGILRETDWFSQGTRDLIDLCVRLAIIKDLFQAEPPFLILDDPFVNLDEENTSQLASILQKMSGEWQILYFTCHSSRLPV